MKNDKPIDTVIIGGGISGLMITCFLERWGISYHLLEQKSHLFDNASGVAGAFILPIIGKDTPRKRFFDEAFAFSTNFYKGLNIDIDYGAYALVDEFLNYEVPYKKSCLYGESAYFLPDAMRIPPLALTPIIDHQNISFGYTVKSIQPKDTQWVINGELLAQKVIIATGYDETLIKAPYIEIDGILGSALELRTFTQVPHSFHKNIYCSQSDKDGRLFIGSTHHRLKRGEPSNEKDLVQNDSDYLINELAQYLPPKESLQHRVQKVGIRGCTKDYLPMVGEMIDATASLKKYPALIHGLKIEAKRLSYHKGLYVCAGLGGRGYTLAPYVANALCGLIYKGLPLREDMSLYPRFLRYARRLGKVVQPISQPT